MAMALLIQLGHMIGIVGKLYAAYIYLPELVMAMALLIQLGHMIGIVGKLYAAYIYLPDIRFVSTSA